MERVCVPYVHMELPLAARRGGPGVLVRVCSPVAGSTLTSAPVSIRKRLFETVSLRNNRPSAWPAAEAINGDRPSRFPTSNCTVVGTASQHSQICGGRNKSSCQAVSRLSRVVYVRRWIPYWHRDTPTVRRHAWLVHGDPLSWRQPTGSEYPQEDVLGTAG